MIKFSLFLLLFIFSVSCGEQTGDNKDTKIEINDNSTSFSERLKVLDKDLDIINPDESQASNLLLKSNSYFDLKLVAELSPPTVQETVLQATDVFIAGSKVLVSYNVAGSVKKGAIDLIDLKNSKDPKITSQVTFSDKDINAITYSSGYLYATGSQESEKPSFVSKIKIEKTKFILDIGNIDLNGYAGTDVEVENNKIFVTTGDNSGLYIIENEKLEVEHYLNLYDSRSVGIDKPNSSILVLGGQPANISSIDYKGVEISKHDIEGATIPESKSTIQVGSTRTLAAVGDGGAKIICNLTGEVLIHIPQPKLEGVDLSKTVTNAAAAYGNYIFLANGEAGVYVYTTKDSSNRKNKCQDLEVSLLGKVNFGEDLSANHVTFRHNFLFVADGLGGLKILTINRLHNFLEDEITDFDRKDDDHKETLDDEDD